MRWLGVLVLLFGASAWGRGRDGIDYGAYVPFVVEERRAQLERHVRRLFWRLAGPERCAQCNGGGWIPKDNPSGNPNAAQQTRCPMCLGKHDQWLREQKKEALEKFLTAALDPTSPASRRAYMRGKWGSSRQAPERLHCDVSRDTATVTARGHKLFPLQFRRVRGQWVLHDEAVHGKFNHRPGFRRAATRARVVGVKAADVLVLEDDVEVRVCGIVIPGGGLAAPRGVKKPDPAAREFVRNKLVGKTVTLTPDDYAGTTAAGRALVFVDLDDGTDLGELLLKKGLATGHPAVHMRRRVYRKAEGEAKGRRLGWWKEHFGPTVRLRRALLDKGSRLTMAGKSAEAEPVLKHALKYGRGRDVLFRLGICLLDQKKFVEAEGVCRECLAMYKKFPDSRERYSVMSYLGESLAEQGWYAEAEPLLIEGYERLTVPNFKRIAGERVVKLYEKWGKPEKVAAWREKTKLR